MKTDPLQLPTVTALVVTYKSGAYLRECLYALRADSNINEIVITNNGNEKAEEDWLNSFSKSSENGRVKLIKSAEGNVGFAKGVNIAAKAANSECLLIINPDAVLRPGSIKALEAARKTNISPCLVGGKLHYPNGQEQRGGRRELLTPWRAFVSFSGLGRLEKLFPAFRDLHREKDPEPETPIPMPVISGAFCYMSAEDYWAVGGFDERYFLHVEDIDLCKRVGEAGGEVIYTPFASVMHYGATSRVSSEFVEKNKAKGLSQFFEHDATTAVGRMTAKSAYYAFFALLVGRTILLKGLTKIRALLS